MWAGLGWASPDNWAELRPRKEWADISPRGLLFFLGGWVGPGQAIWSRPELARSNYRVNYFAPRMLNEFSFCR